MSKTRTVELSLLQLETIVQVLKQAKDKHDGQEVKAIMEFDDDGHSRFSSGFKFGVELAE